MEDFDEIDLRQIFKFFSRNFFVILIALFVGITAWLSYLDLAPPLYESSAKIWIQNSSLRIPPFPNLGISDLPDNAKLRTYREIIRTRTIVEATIDQLIAEGSYDPLPIHNSLILRIFNFMSRPNDLEIDEWKNSVVEDLIKKNLKVETARLTDLIEIRVRQKNKDRAKLVADRITVVFQNYIRSDMQKKLRATATFATSSLDQIKLELENSETAIRQFQIENRTVDLSVETEMLIKKLTETELQKMNLKQKIGGAKSRIETLTANLDQTDEKILSAETLTDHPNVVKLKQQLHFDLIKFEQLKQKYPNHDHPQITQLQTKIDQTKAEIAREDRRYVLSETVSINPIHQSLAEQIIVGIAEIRSAENELLGTENQLQNYEIAIGDLPQKQMDLARLKRRIGLNRKLYENLESAKQQAVIGSVAELGDVEILETATLAKFPIYPNKILSFATAVLISIILGIAIASVREVINDSYRDLNEVKKELEITDQTQGVLIEMPNIRGQSILTTYDQPRSASAEAFRKLRTRIQFLSLGETPRIISITSANPGEGKSTIASNLAIALAQQNRRVILIDADLRRPIQHHHFSQNGKPLSAEPGFSDLLLGLHNDPNENWDDYFQKTQIENLDLLPSGTIPPNPSELLSSTQMDNVLTTLTHEYNYQYILFDTPPIRLVTDALILAEISDVVLFVFDLEKTLRSDFRSGLETLSAIDSNKIAMVCNLSHRRHLRRYQNGYGYYS